MQVKFLRDTGVNGQHYAAGAVADLDAREARIVCAIGKAQPFEAPIDTTGPLTTDAAEGLVPEGRKFSRKSKG